MMKFILPLLLAIAPQAANAAGLGCDDTGGGFALEKIAARARGSQIAGCVNRSFEALSSSIPILGLGATNYFSKLLVDEIGAYTKTDITISSAVTITGSSLTVGNAGTITPMKITIANNGTLVPALFLEDTNSTDGGIRIRPYENGVGGGIDFGGITTILSDGANPANMTSDGSTASGNFSFTGGVGASDSRFIFLYAPNGTDQAVVTMVEINGVVTTLSQQLKVAGTTTMGSSLTVNAAFLTGGAQTLDGGAFIFNSNNTDYDAIFKSVGNSKSLVIQGSEGYVGVSDPAPDVHLSVLKADNGSDDIFKVQANNETAGIGMGYQRISALGTNQALNILSNGTGEINLNMTAGGNINIGTPVVSRSSVTIKEDLLLTQEGNAVDSVLRLSADNFSDNIIEMYNAGGSLSGRFFFDSSGSDFFIENTVSSNDADIIWETSNTERMRLKGTGLLGVGTSAPGTTLHTNGSTLASYIAGNLDDDIVLISGQPRSATVQDNSSIADNQWHIGIGNNVVGAILRLAKTRATDTAADIIVQDGDGLGVITFAGSDGAGRYRVGAQIQANVDGTPGSADMPGELVFMTTADGAATPTARMTIDDVGDVAIGGSPSSLVKLEIQEAGAAAVTQNLFELVNPTAGRGMLFGLDTSNKFGYFRADDVSDYGFQFQGTAGSLKFLTMKPDGSTGINEAAPNAALEVKPYDTHAFTLQVSSQNGTAVMVIDRLGKMGVGTTAPSAIAHFQSATTSDILRVEATNVNGNPNINIMNPNQSWKIQTVGARSDGFEIADATAGSGAGDVILTILPASGGVIIQDSFHSGGTAIKSTFTATGFLETNGACIGGACTATAETFSMISGAALPFSVDKTVSGAVTANFSNSGGALEVDFLASDGKGIVAYAAGGNSNFVGTKSTQDFCIGTSIGSCKLYVAHSSARIAIGTDTTPDAKLEIIPTDSDDYTIQVSSQDDTNVFSVDRFGHEIHGGAAPSVSAGSVVGNDRVGTITLGAGTSVVLTFAEPFTNPPSCHCDYDHANFCRVATVTTSAVTFFNAPGTSFKAYYTCKGWE